MKMEGSSTSLAMPLLEEIMCCISARKNEECNFIEAKFLNSIC